MRTLPGSIAVVSLLALAACGSDGTASPATVPIATDPGTTEPAIPPATDEQITIDDIDIQPDGEPAGPLFGVSAASEDRDPSSEGVCTTQGRCEPDAVEPLTPFVPLPEHQAFCSLLAEMEERPLPDDDFEQLVVFQSWFQELRAVTPAEIAEPFDVVIAFIDDAVASQTFDFEADIDGEVDDASDVLGDFVSDSC